MDGTIFAPIPPPRGGTNKSGGLHAPWLQNSESSLSRLLAADLYSHAERKIAWVIEYGIALYIDFVRLTIDTHRELWCVSMVSLPDVLPMHPPLLPFQNDC